MLTLSEIRQGQSVKILKIEGGCGLHQRLNNLGIREGITIEKITKAFSRSPIIVKVGSSQIALGRGMASKIKVEVL